MPPTRTPFPRTAAMLGLLAGLAAAAPARASVFLFDFDNTPQGTQTPTTQPSATSSQFTATFSSPQDPGGFAVFNAPSGVFQTIAGNYVATNAPGNALDISFTAALSSVALDFFLYGGATTVDYQLLSGGVNGTPVASGTATAGLTDPFGMEGALNVTGVVFDTIALLPGAAAGLAIDNLTVDTTTVPEPASLALLGGGLVWLGMATRRRR